MLYRYPEDPTTRSFYQSSYKYSTPFSDIYSFPGSSSLSPYEHFSEQYTTPLYQPIYSTTSSFGGFSDPSQSDYISNNIYDGSSTTTRTNVYQNYIKNNYRYTASSPGFPKTYSSPNDVSYHKITPFKYKTSVTSTSLTRTTNGKQYGPSKGHGKRIVTESSFFYTFSLVHDSSSSFSACEHH